MNNVYGKAIEAGEPMIKRLQEQGLVMSGRQGARALLCPFALALSVPIIGLIKIAVGVSHDRPVGFLIILTALTAIVAVAGFARKPHRSRRGDLVLNRLKETHEKLTHGELGLGTASGTLPLAVGLFGLGGPREHRSGEPGAATGGTGQLCQ